MPRDTSWHTRRTVLRSFAALGIAGGFGGSVLAEQGNERSREWIVGCRQGRWPLAAMEVAVGWDLPSTGAVTWKDDTLDCLKIECEPEDYSAMRSSLASLQDRWYVDFVEPNGTLEAVGQVQAAANDSLLGQQYGPDLVNAPAAWDVTLGDQSVTIGIVDSGVDYTHPDIADQFGSDKGHDFVDDDGDPAPPSPDESHGTHVAGIAAATTGDGRGIAGISNSRLLSARCLGGRTGSFDTIAAGIRYCAEQGADVINMSLGGGQESEAVKRAIDFAIDRGALPVAAAGNDGKRGVSFPASYGPVVAVSAIDQNEQLADLTPSPLTGSNFGPNVDVTAPGQDILSSVPGGGHEEKPGTSMAAPAVSGVAALGLALDGGRSPGQLRNDLTATARDVGLSREEQGAGCVDARALVDRVRGAGGGGGGGGSGGPVADGVYQLVNVNSGKVLDVNGGVGATHNGANIHQWEDLGARNQQWRLTHEGGGLYSVASIHTGSRKVLDVDGGEGATHNGANVHQWEDIGARNQRWRLDPQGNGEFLLLAEHSGKALEVNNFQGHNGANVQQWEALGHRAQRWQLDPV